MSSPTPADAAVELLPYPGLRPFRADETHLYFGRERHRAELLRRMSATRFVAVVGTSGSGKSSLLHAGILPDLLCGYLPRTGSDWVIVETTPGADPMGRLAAAFSHAGWSTDATALRTDSSHVLELATRHLGTGQHVLVLVDQLEELFRLQFSDDADVDADEKAAFVRLLLTTGGQRPEVPNQRPDVHLVIAMRSEFLGRASVYRGLPEAIDQGQYLIPRLSREQLRQAIECPARVAGGDVDDALVQRLLIELGDDQDQLPLLQHALMRCWQFKEDGRIGFHAYNTSGGLKRALSHDANEALNDAMRATDSRADQILKRVFQALRETDAHGGQTRRPTAVADLCELAGCTVEELTAALAPFRARSFVLPPPAASLEASTLVDISHEALLRGWDTLGQWIEEDERDSRLYLRIARRAADELGSARPDYFGPPLLPVLVKFWSDRKPSETWAVRHHKGYGAARAFLEASEQHQQELEAAEAQRKQVLAEAIKKLARMKRLAWMGAAVGVSLFMAYRVNVSFEERQRLQRDSERLEGQLVSDNVGRVPAAQVEARLQLAVEAARRLQTSDAQKQLLEVLLAAPTPVEVEWAAATAGDDEVTSVAVSPDGQRVFFVAARTLHGIDVAARRSRFSTPLDGATGDVPFLMLAGTKVLVFDAGHAYLVDGHTGKKLGLPVDDLRAATVSADGTTAAFLVGNDLVLCDLRTDCATRRRHDIKRFAAVDLALSADGASVAIIGERLTLFTTRPWAWRADTTLDGAGSVLAIGASGGAIQLCTTAELRTYDADDYTLDTRVLRRFAPEASACVLSPTTVLTSHPDGAVRVWTVEGALRSLAPTGVNQPQRMTVSDHAIAVSHSGLRMWDLTQFGRRRDGGELLRFVKRNGYVLGRTLQALDAGKNEPAPPLELEGHTLVAVSDSLELAAYVPRESSRSRHLDGPLQVREVVLAELRPGMPPAVRWRTTPPASDGPSGPRLAPPRPPVVISDDNRYVAVQRDEAVVILSARDNSEVRTLPGKWNVAFTPTAEVLALDEKGIAVVSLADGRERPLPDWQQAQGANLADSRRLNALPELAFSHDGSLLAMADNRSDRSIVRVYRWPEMAALTPLPHQANVTHIAFRPDGQALVTSTAEATTHAWDVRTAREILRLPALGAAAGTTAAVFTPSGQIAVLDATGLSVLPSDPSAWQAQACQRITRNLSEEEWELAVGSDVKFNKTCPDKP